MWRLESLTPAAGYDGQCIVKVIGLSIRLR